MNRKLTLKEYILLASMLFGMFFGAGNLIFPVSMGQQAGANLWPAIIGFCLTGVGLPLLGIVPEDQNVVLAAAFRQPLLGYTGKGAAAACRRIAKRITGLTVPVPNK